MFRSRKRNQSSGFVRSSYARRLRAEQLEERQMLTTVTVGNNTDLDNAPDTSSIAALIADDGGDGISLREAIAATNNTSGADTITFDPSLTGQTIHLSAAGGSLIITDSVTIDGDINDDRVADITIDADSAAGLDDADTAVIRVFGSGNEIVLDGLIVRDGNTLTSENAGFGGGIQIGSGAGNLTLINSSVLDNTADQDGGGIHIPTGTLSLTGSTVSGNSGGGSGGGIYTLSGVVTLNNSTISGNTASFEGGGINTLSGVVTLNNSTVSSNFGSNRGGGIISTRGGAVTLNNSTISGNITGNGFAQGGGIYINFGSATLNNSTVSGNTGKTGGGIYTVTAAVTLNSSTVSANNALGAGGGIQLSQVGTSSAVTINNSIVAGNFANNSAPDLLTRGTPLVTFSLIGDKAGTSLAEAPVGSPDANGNLIGGNTNGVIDPLLSTLADNGGPTLTHGLLPGSPALDAGFSTIASDQRGLPRPADLSSVSNAVGGNGSDIGATELQELPSLIVTTGYDLIANDGVTSLREAINFANSQTGTDTITFDSSLSGGTITLGGTRLESNGTLTIDASALADGVTLDANNNSRVLVHSGGPTDSITMRGLTLTGGVTGGNGGGLYSYDADIILENTIITGNTSVGAGGGIQTQGGNITLTDSTVSNNSTSGSAARGGGITTNSGSVMLISSTISGNASAGSGGGIASTSGAITLNRSTASGNTSGFNGGGVYTDTGAVQITGSTISGNETAGNYGGGVFAQSGSTVTIGSSTITDNTSVVSGGGVVTFGVTTFTNSLIAGNGVSGTVAGTSVDAAGTGSNFSGDFNLLGVSDGVAGTGNLTAVIDPGLAQLANNGGLTLTHALLPGSPALDAGNSTIATDQRGLPRPADLSSIANAVGGNGSDIGAFEFQPEQPSLIVTTAVDVVDNTDFVTSLREAINFANSTAGADTITFDNSVFNGEAADVIRLQLGELMISEAATIDAAALGVVISADSAGDDTLVAGTFITDIAASDTAGTLADNNSRVFNVNASAEDTVQFTGLTITGGRATGSDGGGGIFASSGDVNLNSSTVSGNTSSEGGGIYTDSGVVTLTSSTVSGNTSSNNGGGIYTRSGAVMLTSSTVSGNISTGPEEDGAGIFTRSGAVTLISSTVRDNRATGSATFGGGISTRSGAVTLISSTVSGNTSGESGGGIYTNSGAVTLTNSTVSGNRTTGGFTFGGGISTNSGAVTLTGSTISGNRATGSDAYGGGVYTRSGAVTLTGSTISGNRATGSDAYGGGIFTYSGAVTLTSSTITANTSSQFGGGVHVSNDNSTVIENTIIAGNTDGGAAPDLRLDPNNPLTINNSLIGDTTGSGITTSSGTGNLLSTNPLLGDLADNGGPTLTHALLPGSPALNAGDPNFDPNAFTPPLVNDQRGDGFARVIGSVIDIGAFEQQAEFDSLIVTTASDVVDNTDFVTSLREAINFANATDGADTITFDTSVFNGEADDVIRLQLGELTISEAATIDAAALGVVISADSAGDDTLVDGTFITDIAASNTAGTLADNNSRIFNVTAPTGDVVQLTGLTLTGGNNSSVGGGIATFSSDLTLNGSVVSGNHSEVEGGGISTFNGAVTLTNSTISGNQSGRNGGGINTLSGAVTLTSSTVTGNSSAELGGGIALDPNTTASTAGSVSLLNSIVAGNLQNGIASDINAENGAAGLVTSSFSLIGANLGTDLAEAQTADASGNLIGSAAGSGVIAPLLAPLADNGGPTLTHALLPGSPAIDAGNSTLTNDQRGFARPVDQPTSANATGGNGSDIGAFELEVVPSADFDADGDVDGGDFLAWQRGFGSATPAPSDGDADGDNDVDADDLTVWQDQYGQNSAPVLAVSQSESSVVGSRQESVEPVPGSTLTAELIDAAIAAAVSDTDDVFNSEDVTQQTVVFSQSSFAETTTSLAGLTPHQTDSQVSTATHDEEADEEALWLSEELLEAVFS